MTKGQKIILIFLGVIGVIYLSYKTSYPTYSWNQKLTVEVETPEGVVSGSSVVAVRWDRHPTLFLPDRVGVKNQVSGEAAIVQLQDGRYLFSLIDSDASTLALRIFSNTKITTAVLSRYLAAGEVESADHLSRTVPRELYPILVAFDDLGDPNTLRHVDPDNLGSIFGAGYSIKSVRIELVDEEVTRGNVTKIILWLSDLSRPIGGDVISSNGRPLFNARKWHFIKE